MLNLKSLKIQILLVSTWMVGGTAFSLDSSFYYMDRVAGSFSSSVIDTNGDSVPGTEGSLRGYSTRGQVAVQFFTEFDILAAAPSAECPPDFLEVPIVSSSSVITFFNGDVLMLRTTSETMCGNLETGQFLWSEVLEVIGGTGWFEEASGSLDAQGAGWILESDPTGAVSFGAVQMVTRGKIRSSIN